MCEAYLVYGRYCRCYLAGCNTVGGYQRLEREFCCHLQGRYRPERLQPEFNDSIRNMAFIVRVHRVFILRSFYDVTPCILVHTNTVKMDALRYAGEVGVRLYFISCSMQTVIHSFIHSFHWHVQNSTIPCCSQELLPFLSAMYFSCNPSPPTLLPSCLTSSCHLFLGLPLDLVVPKCRL